MVTRETDQSRVGEWISFPLEMAQFARGRKVGEAIVTIKNLREAFPDVMDVFRDNRLKIFRVYGGTDDSSNFTATFLIFFETEESSITLESLSKKLASLDAVVTVLVRGVSDFLVDTSAIPLLECGNPAILVRSRTLTEIEESIARTLGPKASSILLWAGWEVGRSDAKWLTSIIGVKQVQFRLETLLNVRQSAGWGVFEIQNLDDKTISGKIVVDNSIETIEKRAASPEPICHLMKGYLAGALSEIFQKPLDVTETRCKAQGFGTCEFEFGLGT